MKTDDWDKILAALTERLATPSAALPSVRWISAPRLTNLLVAVRGGLDICGKKALTGKRLLENLRHSGLAHELVIPDVPQGQKPLRIYRLGIGGVQKATPLELLQAAKPTGVVCYFSALQFHDLTTQVAPHHHIARLEVVAKPGTTSAGAEGLAATPVSGEDGAHPEEGSMAADRALGTLLFHYEGVPYYWTRRDPALVPGVQWAYLSGETMVRSATLEQTLLDTLHRPWSCGGPAVVFEAWTRGTERLDAERLANHLRAIARPILSRRVGYMLEHCEYNTDNTELSEVMRKARESAPCEPMLPLLPEVPFEAVDPAWNLGIPA